MAKIKKVVRHRSAKTGEYVTERYAKKHPSTTVRETDKVKVKKK
ncbi:MAG: multidrug transporter [Acidimicrobiia bacterium]|nr:multidrug transporter [Acidimicrobiia bacterium]